MKIDEFFFFFTRNILGKDVVSSAAIFREIIFLFTIDVVGGQKFQLLTLLIIFLGNTSAGT